MPAAPGTRVLIGSVGYRNLCDHSFGVLVVEALARREWPEGVSIEDVSYSPIALVHRLADDPPERRFSRAVFVSGVQRPGRAPGTLSLYRWDRALPDPAQIQAAVAEAVTGVIAIDNTLVVARHFDVLPRDVVIIELEPVVHEFGDALSEPAAAVFDRACAAAASAALDPSFVLRVPETPLGGGTRLRGPDPVPRISHVD
jgi:hydrogenase maturation protease